ncbi:MAG: PilZ domain-containing protein [Candidatus Sulfotelmatobacter sp.]
MEAQNQAATAPVRDLPDARRQPRFKLDVDIRINTKTCGVLMGRTVDISESGISALLKLEVPVGEFVELQFTLPFGPVTVYAIVRQRNAFRYGFQFVESNAVHEIIQTTCRSLEMEQSLFGGNK